MCDFGEFLLDSVSPCTLYLSSQSHNVLSVQPDSQKTQPNASGISVRCLTSRRQHAWGGPATQNPRSVTTILSAYLTTLLYPEESSCVVGDDHIPFSSPLKFRKSCVVAFIHLSAVLLVSLGRKARWTSERFASAAAPAEGCFFIIVRLQTDAAWRAGWLSQHTVTWLRRSQRPHVRFVLLPNEYKQTEKNTSHFNLAPLVSRMWPDWVLMCWPTRCEVMNCFKTKHGFHFLIRHPFLWVYEEKIIVRSHF